LPFTDMPVAEILDIDVDASECQRPGLVRQWSGMFRRAASTADASRPG